MSVPMTIAEIKALFVQTMKDEVLYWHSKAVAASNDHDWEGCRKALNAQEVAILNLIKLTQDSAEQR